MTTKTAFIILARIFIFILFFMNVLVLIFVLQNEVVTSDFPIDRRYKLDESSTGDQFEFCFSASMKMKECSKTTALYSLLWRHSYEISRVCCYAISTIAQKCWPTTLTSFPYTFEEIKILRGYCDTLLSPPPPASPARGHHLRFDDLSPDTASMPELTQGD
jgi:hypothetical protein